MPEPVEPPPSPWRFPWLADRRQARAAGQVPPTDFVALGADLEPGTVLAAYRRGIFPMPVELDEGGSLGWWSPVERGVLPVEGLRVSRSLRRSVRDFEIRVDTAFDRVVTACADPSREGGWIDDSIRRAYGELHRLGWAHSVECWQGDRLVGGLYGVAIGGLFAGESMFHRARDASKVALVGLVERLRDEYAGERLIDVQWVTPHLASLGVVGVPREEYLERLSHALRVPPPPLVP